MKTVSLLRFVLCALTFDLISRAADANPPPAPEASALESAGDLIRRVLPGQADAFVCEGIAPESGRDVFEYEAGPAGKIVLRGNNGVSLAVAFNQYLRHEAQ